LISPVDAAPATEAVPQAIAALQPANSRRPVLR